MKLSYRAVGDTRLREPGGAQLGEHARPERGQLETQLANRMPTLNNVLAKVNVSLSDVTAALLAENAVMAQAGQSAANTIVGRGAHCHASAAHLADP